MALAKIILCKQQKVGEHYAQRYIVFGNAGSSLNSYRGVRLFSGRQLLGETGGVRKIPHGLAAAAQRSAPRLPAISPVSGEPRLTYRAN